MSKSVAKPLLESVLPPGMRATRATRAMLALLRSSAQERFSAAEMEAALARKGVAVNRVTVFRALDRLHQAGVLLKKVGDDRVNRYQWLMEPRPVSTAAGEQLNPTEALQVLWQCQHCQQTQEVPAQPSVMLAVQVLAGACASGAVQRIQLQGICSDCTE